MTFSVNMDPEVVKCLMAEEARKLISESLDVESLRALKTSTAADLLEMDKKSFLLLAKARGLKPLPFGPRMTRWRYTDIQTLLEPDA